MEQRKLIQHGLSSLTLSLPSKWLKIRKLKKGDFIYVKEEGNNLILSTKEAIKIEKVSVDVTKLDRTSALLYIMSLYRYGYNEIEVKFSKKTTLHHRRNKYVNYSSIAHEIVNRLIGSEIVEQSENRILIKYLTKESEEDFRIILRRIFLLIKECSHTFLDGVKRKDLNNLKMIEDMHDNINKFINYALRLLNKYGYPDVKKTSFYYHIIASLDKIVDVFKYNARDLINYNKKVHKDTIEVIEQVNHSILLYYEFFYKFSLEKVNELSKNRDHVKQLIKDKSKKIPREELLYVNNMKQILEIMLDLTDFRMGLEH